MLVISGSDLVGKSTMVQACVKLLQEHYGLPHMAHHLSRPSPAFDYFNNYKERMCVNSIWDRFALDSLAYRQHDDHFCSLTPLKWDLVQAELIANCGFQVVLWAQPHEIKQRFEQKGDPLYSLEHIQKINVEFCHIAHAMSVGVRGKQYIPRCDVIGSVTGSGGEFDIETPKVTPEAVCEAYVERYTEFYELVRS